MRILHALRPWLKQLAAVALVFALLGVVAGIGKDPARLFWDAIAHFSLHFFGALTIAAPILGGVLIYRRIRLSRLEARIRREYGD
jgi:hypothetical protein